MKTISKVTGALMIAALFAFSDVAQTPAKPAKPAATPKPAKAAKTAPTPKADADIQADIQKHLSSDAALKGEAITVAVAGGVATFTGTVKSAGSKNAVAGIAKKAGAKSTVNNITVEAPPKKK